MPLQSSALLQSEPGIITTNKHTDLQTQASLMNVTEYSRWRWSNPISRASTRRGEGQDDTCAVTYHPPATTSEDTSNGHLPCESCRRTAMLISTRHENTFKWQLRAYPMLTAYISRSSAMAVFQLR